VAALAQAFRKIVSYPPRTRKNIATSDGTLIFAPSARLEGGTALTAEIAGAMGKPLLIVWLDEKDSAERVRRWASEHRVFWVNVAGPRASKGEKLTALVQTTLSGAFDASASVPSRYRDSVLPKGVLRD